MSTTFTAQQLIRQSLTLLGILGQGEALSAPDAQDALLLLNGLMDGFATQRLTMPASSRETFAIISGQEIYTIGPIGDFDTVRPTTIDLITLVQFPDSPQQVEIPLSEMDDQSYDQLKTKTLTNALPTAYYYNATYADGLGRLYFWPIATDTANRWAIYTPTALTQFPGLATAVTMAPGYYRMLLYNLAVECAPMWGRPLDPVIVANADRSLNDIKRLNLQMVDLGSGTGLGTGGLYNILSDTRRSS